MIREGTILDGRYKLLQAIGAGGMGSVWLAEKLATYEKFAIKFIHQHALGDESYYARFTREVQVLRGLRHPNIVDVFDWSIPEPGKRPQAYVVMELLEGVTLQDVVRQHRRLPVAFMNRVMLQVLDGISAVHEMGIIHRDMSPANIYLVGQPNAFPRVKILDFGLAKGIGGSHADSSVTQPGSVLGRAAYAAPEIFTEQDLDVRADIFACGMIFYRSVAGRFPYKETKVDLMWAERYAERHQAADYPSPSRFVSDVPQPIERIIMRALRKRPAGRYSTAMEMQQELLRADSMLAPAQREAAGRFLSTMRDPESATSADGGTPSPGPLGSRSGAGSQHSAASPAASAPTVPPLAPGPSVLATALSGSVLASGSSASSVHPLAPSRPTTPSPPVKPADAAVGTLATGPVVFPAGPAGPAEVGGEAGSTTISATPLPAAHLPQARPTYSLGTTSGALAAGRAEPTEGAVGSTPSAAAPFAGDVSSSIGSYRPAARGLALLWRRPAVLAAASVGLALLIVGTLIVLRGRGASNTPTTESSTAQDAATPSGAPGGDAAGTRTDAGTAADDGGRSADADAEAALEAKADGEALGEDAGRLDDAAAADGVGLPIKPVDDAGPETATDARGDDAAGTRTDAAAATSRTDAAVVRPPRDAGSVRPPADAAVRRDTGTGSGSDDFITEYPGTPQDAGTRPVRDAGTTRPPSDDFITDYPGQRRDAGASRPPSDDFVTNYGSGSTP